MFEVWKLSKLLIVCYTITIVINVSILLSAHCYCSINFTLIYSSIACYSLSLNIILLTNSLRKSMEISRENLLVDIGANKELNLIGSNYIRLISYNL